MMIEHLTTGLTGFSADDFPEAHDFTVELLAEGDGGWAENPGQDTYTRCFKVSRELYDAGWTAALERLRAERGCGQTGDLPPDASEPQSA